MGPSACAAVESTVRNGFCNVLVGDDGLISEVGNGARNPEDLVVAARAERQVRTGARQQAAPSHVRRGVSAQGGDVEGRVAPALSLELQRTAGRHARRDGRARFVARFRFGEQVDGLARHGNVQIDTFGERARYTCAVTRDALR